VPRLPLILAVCALALLAAGSAPALAAWSRPVPGRVVAGYLYTRASPFAAGARRGVDLAARPGAAVLAPCSGVVAYAGPVPGWGSGVTLRCGRLVATLLRLGGLGVRRGAAVLAGRRVGRAGPTGLVRLGARVASDRFGYRDPMGLIGAERRGPALVPRAPRLAPRPPRPRGPRIVSAPAARAPLAPAPTRAPLAAWLGVALLAVSLTAGRGVRVVRRRRASVSAARSSAR